MGPPTGDPWGPAAVLSERVYGLPMITVGVDLAAEAARTAVAALRWGAGRAAALDGVSYYWSSQDPYRNPASFATLTRFAKDVRATRNPDGTAKTWLSPFTPGYNAALLYKTPTCVPRDDGKTMQVLFAGNRASGPDGWTFISWNEISEGSYVVPLQRYGTKYVDDLATLLRQGR